MKAVLNYREYLFEKKSNQNLADIKVKGKAVTRQVDNKLVDAPKSGRKSSKSVKPEMASLPKGKGSSISKSVKPSMSDLPKGKGSSPKKMVDSKTSKIAVKGKAISKAVDAKMAKLPK